MIEICPAILTNDQAEFTRELNDYSKLFSVIDIDINNPGDNFSGLNTVTTEFVANQIKDYSNIRFNIHLMVQNPSIEIEKFNNKLHLTFFIHQEANINKLVGQDKMNLAIQVQSKAKSIDFYKQFNEIQLMTVQIGYQGSKFQPSVLGRVEWLRNEGYIGRISLDGAVDLQTAESIKNYDVNRVSVGSYFSKSTDLELDKQKLELALNVGARS
jgi:pentose-5-phosphate-3-epimerase